MSISTASSAKSVLPIEPAVYCCIGDNPPTVDIVVLGSQPPVDTGGVRRQLYSTVFAEFAENKHIRLFDGPVNHRRPVCTAEARASGLFKVLGMMVAHSICQDGIGFPYFSPTCYWYMVGGEEKALQFASVEDVGGDVAAIVSQVSHPSPVVIFQSCYHFYQIIIK